VRTNVDVTGAGAPETPKVSAPKVSAPKFSAPKFSAP